MTHSASRFRTTVMRKVRSKEGRRHAERGASLVELMVSLVVLAIGILAVAQLLPAGSRGQQKDRMLTSANLFAQEKLEQLRVIDWNDPDLAPGTHGPDSLGANNSYVLTYVVSAMPAPMDQVRRVDVTVDYRMLAARSVTATTYIRR